VAQSWPPFPEAGFGRLVSVLRASRTCDDLHLDLIFDRDSLATPTAVVTASAMPKAIVRRSEAGVDLVRAGPASFFGRSSVWAAGSGHGLCLSAWCGCSNPAASKGTLDQTIAY
jgi:hypothetical protein